MSNGLSKVNPNAQIKFANLKHVSSQVGRSGAVENGNVISKPPVTVRQEKHESSVKNLSERSNPDASCSGNSSNIQKDKPLVQR